MEKSQVQTIDQNEVDRQINFDVWAIRNRITRNWLAEKVGVHPTMISKIIRGQKNTPRIIEELVQLGVPADLLPRPGRKKQD